MEYSCWQLACWSCIANSTVAVKSLRRFGYCQIYLDPHRLEWIGVKFTSNFTSTGLKICWLMRNRLLPNKLSGGGVLPNQPFDIISSKSSKDAWKTSVEVTNWSYIICIVLCMQRVSRTSFFFLIIDLAQGEYIIKHYHLDDTIWTPKKAYLVRGALFFFFGYLVRGTSTAGCE